MFCTNYNDKNYDPKLMDKNPHLSKVPNMIHKQLTKNVNLFMNELKYQYFAKDMNYTKIDNFSLGIEELSVRYYMPKDKKKCYIKLVYKPKKIENGKEVYDKSKDDIWKNTGVYPKFEYCDFETIVSDPVLFANKTFHELYPDLELCCKSFSWALLPEGQVPYFKALCIAILCCEPIKEKDTETDEEAFE
jgi:hypothetical protein